VITVKAGSHVHQLLQMLAISMEFPASSLHLLGSERSIKDLVHKLESVQDIRFPPNESVLQTKMLTVSGWKETRNIRLSKSALPLLEGLHPGAPAYYLRASKNHQLSGDHHHIDRNHRVGEAIAMAAMAGLECRPYVLPQLVKNKLHQVVPAAPSFYIARDFKENHCDDMDKTVFTRVVGLAFSPGGCYAVYNVRNAVMKWSGKGELKVNLHITELVRCNAGLRDVNAVLLLGNTPEIALQTLLESDKSPKRATRIDRLYQYVHFIPLSTDGIQLLRILTLPDWNERVLDALFESEARLKGYGIMEYDAVVDGMYTLSHLDSDLSRLMRFQSALSSQADKQFMVACFPWQRDFLRAYLGERVKLRVISMEDLQNAIE